MVNHVLNAVLPLSPKSGCVVVGPHNKEDVQETVTPIPTVLQSVADGTGSAVGVCEKTFSDFTDGTIVILNGDTPLITTETISRLVQERQDTSSAISIMGFVPQDPSGYGRIVQDDNDSVIAIVEDKECNDEQKQINLCYSGIMAVDAKILFPLVNKISNENAKGEYYLTDIIDLANQQGLSISSCIAEEQQVLGCDSKIDLSNAESIFQYNSRINALANGVLMTAPETVYFSWDTQIGEDVVIEPNVVFGEGVVIEDGVNIRAFSHLEECKIKSNAIIGPFARIRPGTILDEDVKIGNFVEVKNAHIGRGSKINHLSYVGDSEVGENCNFGAGTITCNYNGFEKSITEIGNNVFVGSNSAFIAPLNVADGALIGAGSVVTNDVPENSLVIARANQENVLGAAAAFRNAKKNKQNKE